MDRFRFMGVMFDWLVIIGGLYKGPGPEETRLPNKQKKKSDRLKFDQPPKTQTWARFKTKVWLT